MLYREQGNSWPPVVWINVTVATTLESEAALRLDILNKCMRGNATINIGARRDVLILNALE